MNYENTTATAHFQFSIIHFPLNMTPEAFNRLLQQREKELKRALERFAPFFRFLSLSLRYDKHILVWKTIFLNF